MHQTRLALIFAAGTAQDGCGAATSVDGLLARFGVQDERKIEHDPLATCRYGLTS